MYLLVSDNSVAEHFEDVKKNSGGFSANSFRDRQIYLKNTFI
jgi:hypothetical protein